MSKRQIRRICSLRKQGFTLQQIAADVGYSIWPIRKVLLQRGFPSRVQPAHPKWRGVISPSTQRVLSLRRQGFTLQQIADAVGWSASTARKILLQHGFPPCVQLAHPKWGRRGVRLRKPQILSLRKRGLTVQQIARVVECSTSTIRKTLSRRRLRRRVPPVSSESLKRQVMSLRKQGYSLARIREVTGVPDVTAMRWLKAAGFPRRVPLFHFVQGRIKGICTAMGCGSRRYGPRFCWFHNDLYRRGFLNRKGEAVLPKCIDCGRKFQRHRLAKRCESCVEARDIQLGRLRMRRYWHRRKHRLMKATRRGKFSGNAKAQVRKAGRKQFGSQRA
jgi:lambda repressor-like predicted transcriptional regulator/transposase-like protein